MGCAESTHAIKNADFATAKPPIFFEVPVRDEKDSIVESYPPRKPPERLEKAKTPPPITTQEQLQEKLEEAEKRRLEILNERIRSAKQLMKPRHENGETQVTTIESTD